MFIYINKASCLYPKLNKLQINQILQCEKELLIKEDSLTIQEQQDFLEIIEEDIKSYWTLLEYDLYFQGCKSNENKLFNN